MRINFNGNSRDDALPARSTASADKTGGARSAGSKNETSLPEKATGTAHLVARVLETREVREDRVAALSQKICDGRYQLNPSSIADAIVRHVG